MEEPDGSEVPRLTNSTSSTSLMVLNKELGILKIVLRKAIPRI